MATKVSPVDRAVHIAYEPSCGLPLSSSRAPREMRERMLELEKLNEEKTRWLATAAHDLRHPAGAILVYTELLMEETAETLCEEHKSILESIRTSCEFMLHLLSDVTDIAVSGFKNVPWAFESTDLRLLMEECISLCRPAAMGRQTELAIRYQDAIPPMTVDRWKMQQVFMNLIGNAIKYSQTGASVEVGAAPNHAGVVVWVRDDGPGIPADEIDGIFTPFRKPWRRRPGVEPGTGLGLSICKHIVERHGGRIWVESSAGEGAAFYLTLPFRTDRTS